MAIEIEKKYRLDDRRRAEITALLKTTATYVREDFEENIIFGGGDLAKNSPYCGCAGSAAKRSLPTRNASRPIQILNIRSNTRPRSLILTPLLRSSKVSVLSLR
jgi:hypothetical protein